jgi:MarR family transcriptional regulator, negative regulator of the multidrug operon emrRAB
MAAKSARTANIEKVRREILSMDLNRLVVFADVMNRYLLLRAKGDARTWLRVYTVTFIIARGGRVTPTELAKILLRSRNTVSQLIAGMEKDGLVRRYHTTEDRRTVHVEVTSDGLLFIKTRLEVLKSLEEEISSCLDDGELRIIVDLTRKLRLGLIEKLTGLKS